MPGKPCKVSALLRGLFGKSRSASPRPTASRAALRVETLEDRLVPSGVSLDLTYRGAEAEANGAIFRQFDAQPTGTGVIDSFVRVHAANAKATVEQGYNTDARPLQFDENNSPQFTRSLRLGDVPLVEHNGNFYREFLLDINQRTSSPLLSLDEARIFVGSSPVLTGYDATSKTLAGQGAVWDLDWNYDHWVKLDYRLNPGSGGGDMLMLIPYTAFEGASSDSFVYLFSRFGDNCAANAGFEEWAVREGVGVGEPPPPQQAAGVISGRVFADQDGDGLINASEEGIAGWLVWLDLNNNGLLEENEPWTTTDATGTYTFTGLSLDQTYVVRVEERENWYLTSLAAQLVQLTAIDWSEYDVNFGQMWVEPPPNT
jgi:hypothetical protein